MSLTESSRSALKTQVRISDSNTRIWTFEDFPVIPPKPRFTICTGLAQFPNPRPRVNVMQSRQPHPPAALHVGLLFYKLARQANECRLAPGVCFQSWSFQPVTSFSGSDHSRSVNSPMSGTSMGRRSWRICSKSCLVFQSPMPRGLGFGPSCRLRPSGLSKTPGVLVGIFPPLGSGLSVFCPPIAKSDFWLNAKTRSKQLKT